MLGAANRRYLLGFVAATVIMAAVGLSILFATRQFRDDTRQVEHAQQLIGRIAQIRARLYDGIATQRTYLLTGEPTLRTAYQAVRPAIEDDVDAVAALAAGEAAQLERVRRLQRLIAERLDTADQGVRLFDEQGLAPLQVQLRSMRGLQITRQIEAVASEMQDEEQARLRRGRQDAQQSAALLLGLGVMGIPVSLGILWLIFALLSREVRQREDAERRLVGSVADLERASSELRELAGYSSHLQGCRNLDEAMQATRQVLITLVPWCAGTVYLLRESLDHAEAAMQWGEPLVAHQPSMQGDHCWALRRGRPYAVDDLRRGTPCEHYGRPRETEAVGTVCFPLAAQNVALGVLALSQRRAGPVARQEIAAAVAEQLSLALGNLRLQASLRQQSIRDPLTGLYNRRYLEESLQRELSRCERLGRPLALLMLDVDHFKAFNDAHGHEAGDLLLGAVGQLLAGACRNDDIACRYGGEEFTLILPDIDLADAVRRGDEIRESVSRLVVQHRNERLGAITISIGIAMYPADARDGRALRMAADTALYRAKRLGRDRVETAST